MTKRPSKSHRKHAAKHEPVPPRKKKKHMPRTKPAPEPEPEPELEPDDLDPELEPEPEPDVDEEVDVEDEDDTGSPSVDVSTSPPVTIPEPPPDDVAPPRSKQSPRVVEHTPYSDPHPTLRDASPQSVADYYFEKINPQRFRSLPPVEQKNKALLVELLTAYRNHLTKSKH
jgi:hypothetical protein